MNKKVSIIFFILCCTFLCIIPNYSYATTTTKTIVTGIDRAPRIDYDTTNEKYFKYELKELGKIYFVKLEKVVNGKTTILLNRDNDSKNNKTTNGITISNDKKEIKIPKTLFKEDEYTRLKLTASDSSSPRKNQIISILLIKNRKTKDDEKGWYNINNSPRLSYSDVFTITATDGSKIKSMTVKDINNKNANVTIGNPLNDSTETKKSYKINLKNLKAKNNKYCLRIRVVDQTGIARIEEITIKTKTKTFNSKDKIKYKSVDRSPRIEINRNDQNNFIINLEEKGKVSTVKLEKIENGKTTILLNNNKKDEAITVTNDKKQIKMAKTLLKDNEFTQFKLTANDGNNNELITYFKAKIRKTKDNTKGWYEINASPRLNYANGFKITARDDGKIKSITVKDMNNNNAIVNVGKRLSESTDIKEIYKIDLSKICDENEKYRLKVIVEDKTGMITSEEIVVKTEITYANVGVMKIPYINQGSSEYYSYSFPVHGGTVAGNGCGIASTTMVLQYLTGKNIRLQDVATWADLNGHYNGGGSNGSLFDAAAKKWNVGKAKTVYNMDTVTKALKAGRPVISYQKAGFFTYGRHFIVLTGIDSKGKYHVNNPNGMNQGRTYTASEINNTSLAYYIFDAKK